MPEGDTIFRAARTLDRALAGHRIERFDSVYPALTRIADDGLVVGHIVSGVRAHGKHVLMAIDSGFTLRSHMRMHGSWHIYRPGESWQRPRHEMRILLATASFEAVGFSVPEAEFIRDRDLDRHHRLSSLGPDLLATTFDPAVALACLRAQGDVAIEEALLNQRVMAGLGNVYKSEVLFLCRVHPRTTVRALDDDALMAVITHARRLLLANVSEGLASRLPGGRRRRTSHTDSPSTALWVYGRGGQPCRRCDAPIAIAHTGSDARLTYWCPVCQPAPAGNLAVPAT